MGAGFRFMDIRFDQVIHLGLSLVMVLIFATGLVSLTSARTRAGRVSLILAFGLFIMSYLIGGVFSLFSLAPNPQTILWLSFSRHRQSLDHDWRSKLPRHWLRGFAPADRLAELLQEESLDEQD